MEKFITHFDRGKFHEDKKYTKPEIFYLINDISSEMEFLKEQLKANKDTVICKSGYKKLLRKALHAGGDQILSKCIRKLLHLQTGLRNSSDIIPKTVEIAEPLTKAIDHLTKLRPLLVYSKNTILPKLPSSPLLPKKETLVNMALEDLYHGIENINTIKLKIFEGENFPMQ